MNKQQFDDLLQDLEYDPNNKSKTRLKSQASFDDNNDDWLVSATSKKISTSVTAPRRQNDIDDNDDQDELFNKTSGSNVSYVPSFGGGSTLNTQGQDTMKRIIDQSRPSTSSGFQKFDDLFGDLPPKAPGNADGEKGKRAVRFDDNPTVVRPSTAPSSADKTQNRPNAMSMSSSLRTPLDPSSKSMDMFSSTKTGNEPSKSSNWLGLEDGLSDEEEAQIRPSQKYEPVVTTVVKKPSAPASQQSSTTVVEQPKKSGIDSWLENDKLALTEKTIATQKPTSSKISPGFLFNDQSNSAQRPSLTGLPRTSSITDNQEANQSFKQLFDTKSDSGGDIFKDSKIFSPDPISSTAIRPGSSTHDTKKLEFENNELKRIIEHMKQQYQSEISMLDESNKHRIEYLEKSCERRESRLKEENEHLIRQLNDRTQQYESEKAALLLDYQRRLDDVQRDRTSELENLRTIQRQTLDHLRREHEQTIQRLKQLKQEEISTALNVTTHTRAFESVVDHMEQNARNIDELRLKIEAKHSAILTDKEIEARAKEQQLKAYEERLKMQEADFERERKNLQELISRLEMHLSEQTKLVEEERWKSMQAQKRMEAMQDALNGEQRLFMEKVTRDRAEVQRSKDQLLEDQKVALAGIYESRSQLADERAKLEALQQAFQEQKHRDMIQNATIEAENRAQQKLVAEQLARLEKREQDLIKREEAFVLEKRALTELKQHLDNEQISMRSQNEDLKQRAIEIEHANELIKKEKERLSQLYFELHALDGKNTGRLQQLQKSINTLRQQEEHLNEQYNRMSNEREQLKTFRTNASVKKPTPTSADPTFSITKLVAATPLVSPNNSQQSIEESSLLRALRMNALQDQLYIESEMTFLNNLRLSNHATSRSASLSNIHRHADANLLRTNH